MTYSDKIQDLGLPESDEIEITILGSSNRGESVVVHMGEGKWGVIDCCSDPNGNCFPLLYLQRLGIDLKLVEFIVCSHWHRDHVMKINELLQNCASADFFIGNVGDASSLYKYIIRRVNQCSDTPKGIVYKELYECFQILSRRMKKPKYTSVRTVIAESVKTGISIKAYSPSDAMTEFFHNLLLESSPDEVIANKIDANMCSIACVLAIPNMPSVLLGADLECNRTTHTDDDLLNCPNYCLQNKDLGWCNPIVDDRTFPNYTFDFIKIPHHSSVTAYCPRLWSKQVAQNITGITSSFFSTGGEKLPTEKMMSLYQSLCSKYFLTSEAYSLAKHDRKNGKSEYDKNIEDASLCSHVIVEHAGIVCARKKLNSQEWTIRLLGDARIIDNKIEV